MKLECSHWLTKMKAALAEALNSSCAEASLKALHEAGVYSVRARACALSAGHRSGA